MLTTPVAPTNGHAILKPDEAAAALVSHTTRAMIDAALHHRDLLVEAMQRLMKEDVDYGRIAGSDKPALLQPGADKLCNLFGLVVEYEVIEQVKDWSGKNHNGEPFFYCEVRGYAYKRDESLAGEGVGSCNSWESKYRYRKGERTCPHCGKANIRKSRDGSGSWYCWLKTEGCGATFPAGDPRIESQPVGRILNVDVFDSVNTIQKIAFKRCKISTTINATSASEFFTQDVDEKDKPEPDPKDSSAGNVTTITTTQAQQPTESVKRDPATAPAPVATTAPSEAAAATPMDLTIRDRRARWMKMTSAERGLIFAQLQDTMPSDIYFRVLGDFGVDEFTGFKSASIAFNAIRALEAAAENWRRKAEDPRTFEHFQATEGGRQ